MPEENEVPALPKLSRLESTVFHLVPDTFGELAHRLKATEDQLQAAIGVLVDLGLVRFIRAKELSDRRVWPTKAGNEILDAELRRPVSRARQP